VLVEIAELFRIHRPAYRATFGDRMLPRHRRAMQDIERCRTAPLGGQVYHGETCQAYHDSYHSCQNRPCPTCQQEQAEEWLEHPKRLLLPVPHFMVTLTLPAALSALARRHQKPLDHSLFRSSSEALQELALDRRCISGQIGRVGVLHTWTRELRSPPHVHDIVAGGGLSAEDSWQPSRPDVLVHVTPLSMLFRAKFRDHLHKTVLFPLVEAHVWHKDWGVPGKPVGSGAEAFRSLAPSSFRVAIRNQHILKLEDGHVTFHYKDSATHQTPSTTVPAQAFMRRFLQHVLPNRCINVRYDGFLSPGNRPLLTKVSQ
jgi:Putative transposase/Transposase zinc-binding domain